MNSPKARPPKKARDRTASGVVRRIKRGGNPIRAKRYRNMLLAYARELDEVFPDIVDDRSKALALDRKRMGASMIIRYCDQEVNLGKLAKFLGVTERTAITWNRIIREKYGLAPLKRGPKPREQTTR